MTKYTCFWGAFFGVFAIASVAPTHIPEGTWAGVSEGILSGGTTRSSASVTYTAKSDSLTIEVDESGKTQTRTVDFAFTKNGFFTVSGTDIVSGNGYCFGDKTNTQCHYQAETKAGSLEETLGFVGDKLFLMGSVFNKKTKNYTAWEAGLDDDSLPIAPAPPPPSP